jgi:hypothetical protein
MHALQVVDIGVGLRMSDSGMLWLKLGDDSGMFQFLGFLLFWVIVISL